MIGLGDLPGGSFDSRANGVSADGSIVVGRSNGPNGNEAFLWTESGGMVGLGDLPGGSFSSIAYAVSGDGSFVVGRGNGTNGNEAFLWTETGGMVSLYDFLTAQGDDLSHWTSLSDASGVSADGRTVVGTGINAQGDTEAFVATLFSTPGVEVYPDSFTVTRGDYVSGGTGELADSDNMDFSLRRRQADTLSRTEFEIKSTSPTATPSSFEFTLEGAVFARSNVIQTIELFDYVANDWVLISTSNAARSPNPDTVVTASGTGDLSRFVEAGTMCIETRIHFQSDSPRQKFASNSDQTAWTIGQ